MKKNLVLRNRSGNCDLFIVGGMTYVLRGDFFFRYLSPIFGLAAAVLRFGTATLMKVLAPTLYDDPQKERREPR